MKKTLLFLFCAGLMSSLSFGQELIQNGDFELPDVNQEFSLIDSIPFWHTDDVAGDANGRDSLEDGNNVAWQWDDAGSIYQVIGTVPSVTTNYDFSFDATCMYSWWSDYITDVYVIFSSFSGTDTTARVPIDSLTFRVSCFTDDWLTFVTYDSIFTIEAGSAVAGENLVFEIEIYNSSLFGYGESWTYLWYDNVSVFASTPTTVKEVEDNGINVITRSGMLRITAPDNIQNAKVFDMSGKLLMDARPNTSDVNLNVGHMNRGVYIVKVNAGGKYLTKKVVL